jgi:hypothetical protein
MRFGKWNGRRFYRVGSLRTGTGEMVKYNLDLVAIQEVRWVESGS